MANPTAGQVAAGSATIGSAGEKLTVTQSTDKAVIDWRGFDIAKGETTEFKQPRAESITLNRVNSANPSYIDGHLTANGNLVIVNQNGVLFGRNSVVDVNGIVASTANIDNDKFMSESKLSFDKPGNPNAAIVNEGQITAQKAGLVGLVAPHVLNSGVIEARLGRIHLASGDAATVDLYGDGLMEVKASDKLQEQIVANTGLLKAEGGTIAMTASAAKETVKSLISVSGELDARAVGVKDGSIYIMAEGSNAVQDNIAEDKGQRTGSSTVLVDATIDASGRNEGEHGGKVTITGDNVALLNGTIIDASGSDGKSNTTEGKAISAVREGSAGGDIRIGGDYLGQGTTPTAKNLYVAPYAFVFNDALRTGDAGRTIFWSDAKTQFYGNVYARALGGLDPDPVTGHATAIDGLGADLSKGTVMPAPYQSTGQAPAGIPFSSSGNGGFVETSGHEQLDAGGYVDLTASNGKRGTYFLDPTNITIYGGVTPAFNSSAGITDGTEVSLSTNLKLWLDASDTGSVTLTYNTTGTTATGTSGQNTITTSADVSASLAVGARIRLGGAGAVTTASTLGADTYTITAIAGTTITLDSALTTTYSGVTLYGGFISQLADKSGLGANATQPTPAAMPLWISNGLNGLGVIKFNGTSQYMTASPAFNTAGGGYNSLFFTINLPSSGSQTPFSTHSPTWYNFWLSYPKFGFNEGNGNNYGTDVSGIANTWKQFEAVCHNGLFVGNNFLYIQGQQQALALSGTDVSTALGGTLSIGRQLGGGYYFRGYLSENILYNTALSAHAQSLVNQYQSAKWGLALTGPGVIGAETGLTGAEAQTTMASVQAGATADGYSVFAASYLNRLSQSSDIILLSSNNINLDLQGATLTLEAGRNITLTAGNQILTASSGGITTSQSSGSGGNVTFNATNGIIFNHDFSLNSGGGAINLNNAVTLNANLTANAGSGTLTFGGTVNGAHDLTASAGTLSLTGAIGG
ncbi:MAG: filamentous hemagglutinin N-terminal domain-containing protein, partial [Negativicutes bacterium]|nr:filamentous hemagglutinin N-terminal domain-containing protein [Negativicutes bacterium]